MVSGIDCAAEETSSDSASYAYRAMKPRQHPARSESERSRIALAAGEAGRRAPLPIAPARPPPPWGPAKELWRGPPWWCLRERVGEMSPHVGRGQRYHGLCPWGSTHPILLAMTSGVLLALAMPPFDQWWLMWMGIIPLLIAVNDQPLSRVAGYSYLTGLIFFSSFW